jgi:hypothetical protein
MKGERSRVNYVFSEEKEMWEDLVLMCTTLATFTRRESAEFTEILTKDFFFLIERCVCHAEKEAKRGKGRVINPLVRGGGGGGGGATSLAN